VSLFNGDLVAGGRPDEASLEQTTKAKEQCRRK